MTTPDNSREPFADVPPHHTDLAVTAGRLVLAAGAYDEQDLNAHLAEFMRSGGDAMLLIQFLALEWAGALGAVDPDWRERVSELLRDGEIAQVLNGVEAAPDGSH